MVETRTKKDNTKDKAHDVHTDMIIEGKMHFKVINRYPASNLKNSKYIEKRLFEVFKKYEE